MHSGKWQNVTCECHINVSMNEKSALFVQRKPACPYPDKNDRKAEYEPYTDWYNKTEDRYYCTGQYLVIGMTVYFL